MYAIQHKLTGEFVTVGLEGYLCPTYQYGEAIQTEFHSAATRIAEYVSRHWGRTFEVVRM